MPRPPRPQRQLVKPLDPGIEAYFEDRGDASRSAAVFLLRLDDEEKLWRKHSLGILQKWTEAHPCSRPRAWWKFDSPRSRELMAGTAWAGTIPEPRRRLGGRGVPRYEELPEIPEIVRGLPVSWITEAEVRLWPELAGKQVDPAAPPIFEAEAACLDRLGILTPAERRHLREHPELLEPERIIFEADVNIE